MPQSVRVLEALQNSFKVCPKVYAFWRHLQNTFKVYPKVYFRER